MLVLTTQLVPSDGYNLAEYWEKTERAFCDTV